VTSESLAQLNGLRKTAKLRSGRSLLVPAGAAITVAAAQAAPQPPKPEAAPTETTAANTYVVRRGDSIEEIAKKTGLAQADILKLNGLKNPNYIYEGQKLQIASVTPPATTSPPVASSATPPPSAVTPPPTRPATPAAPPPTPTKPAVTPTKPVVVASSTPAGGVRADEAKRESEEDAELVQKVGKPAARAEPVSAAQAEALGPALGPAIETPQTADPIDYSIGKDDTIVVVAEETLGHYADWLGVTAQQLRKINNMKFGRPVIIGRKVKLDFSKVKPEEFEATRREYHRTLQATYFAEHRILGTEVYIVRRGDSLWTVTQRYQRLPMWLLQQYNPDFDFSEMRPGTEIVVPKVEEVASESG
jgi:membrane-bound lytic murein transglycosylase D